MSIQTSSNINTAASFFVIEIRFQSSKIKSLDFLHFDKQSPRSRKFWAKSLPNGLGYRIGGDGIRKRVVGQAKSLVVRLMELFGNAPSSENDPLVDEINMFKRLSGLNFRAVTVRREDTLRDLQELSDGSDKELKSLLKHLIKESVDAGSLMPDSSQFAAAGPSIEAVKSFILQKQSSDSVPQIPHHDLKLDAYEQGTGYIMVVAQSKFDRHDKPRNIKEDLKEIQGTFQGHLFKPFQNLEKHELEEKIEDAVKELNTGKYAFFAFFSLSHGGICKAKIVREIRRAESQTTASDTPSVVSSKDTNGTQIPNDATIDGEGEDPDVEMDYISDPKGKKIFFFKDIVKKFSNSACEGHKGKDSNPKNSSQGLLPLKYA